MLSSLVLASMLSFTTPTPIVFGFDAVQCERVRQVACVEDRYRPWNTCVRDMVQAINIVNQAVGRQVFESAGIISMEGAEQAYRSGVMIVGVDELAESSLGRLMGLTHHSDILKNKTVCINHVAMAISDETTHLPEHARMLVLVHELVHALGANHADPDGAFLSRMQPTVLWSQWYFSPADIKTLRSVYGPVLCRLEMSDEECDASRE